MNKLKVLLPALTLLTLSYTFKCMTHENECETLREHIKKNKTINPNGYN